MRTKLIWMSKDSPVMKGRETIISDFSGRVLSRIPIPDDEIICDICNAEVTEEPFVILDSYVLCTECRERMGIQSGQEYYSEH